MKKNLTLLVCLLVLACPWLLEAQSASHVNALRVSPATSAGQEFFCVGPYSVAECGAQTAFLQAVLRKYDAEKLGKWSWILIRSEDWKQFASQLHLNPASPAFSHLGYRQTFLDEALLVLKPKRELELITKWNISFDRFLEFAVTHELGHAFCQESDEIKAERFGQRLRKSSVRVCDTKKQHNLLAEVH
jgi:hypothetical protein